MIKQLPLNTVGLTVQPYSNLNLLIQRILDFKNKKEVSLVLKVINHKFRLQLLLLIHQKGKLSTKDIYILFKGKWSTISKQLGILYTAGLLKKERSGYYIYYSIDDEEIKKVNELLK